MSNLFEVKKEVFEEAVVKAVKALDLLEGKVLDEPRIYEVFIAEGRYTSSYYNDCFTREVRYKRTSDEIHTLLDKLGSLPRVNGYQIESWGYRHYIANVYTNTEHTVKKVRESLSRFIESSPAVLSNVENTMLTKGDVEIIERLKESPTMGIDTSKLIPEEVYRRNLDLIVEGEFQKSLKDFEERCMANLKAIEKNLEEWDKIKDSEDIDTSLKRWSAFTVLSVVALVLVGWWLW